MMRAVAVAMTLAFLVAGCATPTRTAGTSETPDAAPTFEVLEESAPTGVVRAEDLCSLTTGRRTYVIVDDDGFATDAKLVVERRLRGDGGEDVEVDMGEDLTLFLGARADGGVEQHAVVAHDQAALTRFDPPLVIAFSELRPGELRESRSRMRVVDVRDTRRERESGNAVRTIEYVGDTRIITPVGELRAQRVDVTFQAKLRMARVSRTETIWVVPGMGVVARDDREKLTIFALPAKNERRLMVVAE